MVIQLYDSVPIVVLKSVKLLVMGTRSSVTSVWRRIGVGLALLMFIARYPVSSLLVIE